MTIGATCTNYASAEVKIVVPRAGTILVSANVMLDIDHTAGTYDNAYTFISNDTTSCTIGPSMAILTVATNLPTSGYWVTVPMEKNYTVAAGSHTFYINGQMESGQDAGDLFYFGYLAAVFYPS